ncbi:MAG TPA: hypothetical protein PLO51_05470 [Candidatus Micrarchaeota archaeon]|nr:hypothetical protein [Candidatus Micrarchaeota archaeon]
MKFRELYKIAKLKQYVRNFALRDSISELSQGAQENSMFQNANAPLRESKPAAAAADAPVKFRSVFNLFFRKKPESIQQAKSEAVT